LSGSEVFLLATAGTPQAAKIILFDRAPRRGTPGR
jgi:hypothetical protein